MVTREENIKGGSDLKTMHDTRQPPKLGRFVLLHLDKIKWCRLLSPFWLRMLSPVVLSPPTISCAVVDILARSVLILHVVDHVIQFHANIMVRPWYMVSGILPVWLQCAAHGMNLIKWADRTRARR